MLVELFVLLLKDVVVGEIIAIDIFTLEVEVVVAVSEMRVDACVDIVFNEVCDAIKEGRDKDGSDDSVDTIESNDVGVGR